MILFYLSLCFLGARGSIGSIESRCLEAAEAVIKATPPNSEEPVTTSHAYKRHVAQHLCDRSGEMTVLELGVYHGHTTALLASMFKKVIAVDLKKDLLKKTTETLGQLERNVVLLEMDLLVDGWSLFSGNHVDVVVIDANHDYEYVRADAENALRYLPHLKYLVFHDSWFDDVERAVTELESAGVMKCEDIGLGADGQEYDMREWDFETNMVTIVKQTKPEGKLCQNLATPQSAIAPSFSERRYLLYKQPVTTLGMCSAGVFRFEPNGVLKAGLWRRGTWKMSNVSHDTFVIRLPKMSARPMQMLFNVDRTAFLLTQLNTAKSDWFGISDHLVYRPFHMADGLF